MPSRRRYVALRAGTTHLEVKSGYGLDVENERRLVELASGLTEDVTFLGAHALPSEYADRSDAYVELVRGEMLAACAPSARWIDVFCEVGAFDVDQSRAVLRAGREPVSGRACTPTSSDTARARSLRWRREQRRPTTAPTSPTTTSTRWRRATQSSRSSQRATSRPASPIRTLAVCSTRGRRLQSQATAIRARATPARWRSASR